MIFLKTEEEIELMRISNQLVGKTQGELAKWIAPGITTLRIDQIAEEFIRDNGAEPAFKGYGGFPNALCISVNDAVVHGFPSKYELREGDVISVDCGTLINGYYGDSAYTFPVGEVKPEVMNLLKTTKESLYKGIEAAVENQRLGDIGFAIQEYCEKRGYSVVREMVGHGIGKSLHEDPQVPNYGRRGRGTKLKSGMVLAIEPMINMGKKNIKIMDDGWTAKTIDGQVSAHFEHTVVVRRGQAEILSTFEYLEEVLGERAI